MAYTKTTWVTGDTVTATKLNHAEDGIANAQSTADGAVSSINTLSANGAINTANLADGAVTTAKLAANAVTSAKIANNSITEDELSDGAVVTAKIEDGAVTSAKIATAAVSGTQIADETITATNIADETLTEAKLDPTFAASLAKVDGSYEGMTVGNAEQLVSTVGVEDSAPYTFRTTGGSADVGDRLNLKKVIGGTVAWNQLQSFGAGTAESAGVTYTKNSDGSITCSGISTGDSYLNLGSTLTGLLNHVLYICGCPKGGSASTYYFRDGYNGNASDRDIGNGKIVKGRSNYVGQIVFLSGVDSNGLVFRPQMFDLTAMFGSTIADYVYTLESGTAGAGVAWLKKYGYFTKPYYPYKAAALESVKTSAHKTIGFNQWDEQWEVGGLSGSTGENVSQSNVIRSKNYIRIIPNTTYYVGSSYSLFICYYDANKNFIGNIGYKANETITTPSNAAYMRFQVNSTYGTTYNNDICINLHWDGERDGEYEPYEQHTYALDDVELRGIPKLDANNNLYYDGDEYTPDGTVTRRYGIVDLGTLTWAYASTANPYFYCKLEGMLPYQQITNSLVYNMVCPKYQTVNWSTFNAASNPPDKTMCRYYANQDGINVRDSAYTDAAAFKTAMSGVYLVYELATPTTETADAYTELQICNDFGTEEFVDAATRDFDMPVGHNTVYQPNLRAKLEMAPNSPDGDGDYIVRQTDGVNEYVLLSEVKELPDLPTTDGTYTLKCTVADGTATLSWVSE